MLPNVFQLLNYFMENKGENYAKAVKEFPILAYDQLGQSVVRDSRLLVPYVMEVYLNNLN